MKLMLYSLFYTVIILIFWLSYISLALSKLQPDHLHAHAASIGAITGLLMIAVKLMTSLHDSDNDGSSDVDGGGE